MLKQGNDPDAEIDPDLADGIAKVGQRAVGIAAGIADDDIAAAPPDHLIDAEIFEMTTVQQIDIGADIVRHAEEFLDDGGDSKTGPSPFQVVRRIGLPEPPAGA